LNIFKFYLNQIKSNQTYLPTQNMKEKRMIIAELVICMSLFHDVNDLPYECHIAYTYAPKSVYWRILNCWFNRLQSINLQVKTFVLVDYFVYLAPITKPVNFRNGCKHRHVGLLLLLLILFTLVRRLTSGR